MRYNQYSEEIKLFLNISDCKWAFTLDAFYGRFSKALKDSKIEKLMITELGDYMGNLTQNLFYLIKGRKIPRPKGAGYCSTRCAVCSAQ